MTQVDDSEETQYYTEREHAVSKMAEIKMVDRFVVREDDPRDVRKKHEHVHRGVDPIPTTAEVIGKTSFMDLKRSDYSFKNVIDTI